MFRQPPNGSNVNVAEQSSPDDVAAADALWLRTVDDAIKGEQTTIAALQAHVAEIDETLTELTTLHENIKYDILVPYGRVSMFPGKMIRTNEVFVHLSPTISVHTSTTHARAILQRRRDYTTEKREQVQQQLDSLRARHAFAQSEKVQDGETVQEIVEAYDEAVHGPLDAPMVSDQVHASRQYHGPPRNSSEQAAEEAALEAMRAFVAHHEGHSDATLSASTDLYGVQSGTVSESTGTNETDSDDENSTHPAPQPMQAAASPSSAYMQSFERAPQLEQEVDRLVAAFESGASTEDGSANATRLDAPTSAGPLIEEVPNGPLQQQDGIRGLGAHAKETIQEPDMQGKQDRAQSKQNHDHMTGLRHGFFNKATKPKKGILKNAAMPAAHAAQSEKTSGPHMSQALADKQALTAAEARAFSGVVKERSGLTAGTPARPDGHQAQGVTDPNQGTKRMSKFKSQRAAAAAIAE